VVTYLFPELLAICHTFSYNGVVYRKGENMLDKKVQCLLNALETIAGQDKTDEVPEWVKADYPEQSAEEQEETWAEYVNEYTFDIHDWLIETAQEGLAKYNNESEEQTTDEDIQIHIETDEEYGRRVSQILESEKQ